MDLEVSGEVESPVTLSWDELNALPRTEHTQDIHCVTRWSKFDMAFEGIHWREIEALVQPRPSARFAIAHSEQGYTANVPISFLRDEQACSRPTRTASRWRLSTAGRSGS